MGIRLEKLVVKFGDFKALNEVTLQIPKGKLVSLLGPSGSGKSTTLFTISGIHKAHSGKIYFGELTFTPTGCLATYYTDEAQIKLGELLNVN